MSKYILDNKEVRYALNQDGDFPDEECAHLASVASSFIKQKTGYDFAQDADIEPLAKELAMKYIRQEYYSRIAEGYNKDYDYSLGIASLISDLQDIARARQVQS